MFREVFVGPARYVTQYDSGNDDHSELWSHRQRADRGSRIPAPAVKHVDQCQLYHAKRLELQEFADEPLRVTAGRLGRAIEEISVWNCIQPGPVRMTRAYGRNRAEGGRPDRTHLTSCMASLSKPGRSTQRRAAKAESRIGCKLTGCDRHGGQALSRSGSTHPRGRDD